MLWFETGRELIAFFAGGVVASTICLIDSVNNFRKNKENKEN